VILISVVEGEGEVSAFPELLRRLGPHIAPAVSLDVRKPHLLPKSKMLHKPGELERAARIKLSGLGEEARLIVLLDADNDCPAELAPKLLNRELGWVLPVQAAIVVAEREYESWFLSSAESLSGKRTLSADLKPPNNPEAAPRDAKKWLSNRMAPRRTYKPTRDQAPFSAALDIELTRSRSASFDKLCREVQRLLTS